MNCVHGDVNRLGWPDLDSIPNSVEEGKHTSNITH